MSSNMENAGVISFSLLCSIGKFKLRRVGRSGPAVAATGKAKGVHDAGLLGEDGTRGTRIEVIAAGVVRGRVMARLLGVFRVAFVAWSPIVTGLHRQLHLAHLQLREHRLRLTPVDGPTALRLEAMQAPPQVALQAFDADPAINRPRLRERVVEALLEQAPGRVGEPLAERCAVQLGARVVVRGVEAPCNATIHKLGTQTTVARDAERPQADERTARLADATDDEASLLVPAIGRLSLCGHAQLPAGQALLQDLNHLTPSALWQVVEVEHRAVGEPRSARGRESDGRRQWHGGKRRCCEHLRALLVRAARLTRLTKIGMPPCAEAGKRTTRGVQATTR
jgi:hypothetical protein